MTLLRSRSGRLAVALVAAAAASGAAALPAHATDSADCAVTGATGTFTPGAGALAAATAGTYRFTAAARCVATDDEGARFATEATITTDGTYSFVDCVTGFMDNQTRAAPTTVDFDDDRLPDITDANLGFAVFGYALQGALTGGTSAEGVQWGGGFLLALTPTSGTCANGGVTAFSLAGSAQLAEIT